MGKGGIAASIRAKNIKIGTRGSGLDNAKAGFKEVCENFDDFNAMYHGLEDDEKAKFDEALGEDLSEALKEGSKNQFESEMENSDDLASNWEKLVVLLD